MVQPLTVLLPGLEPHDFSGSLDNRLIAFMNSNFGLTGSSAGTMKSVTLMIFIYLTA